MDVTPLENGAANPGTLKLDPTNPNTMTTQVFQGLVESIKSYGILQPVVIDQENNVLDGMHRVLAAKQFGTPVPYSRLQVENDADRRIIRQVLNKLKSRHDPIKDAAEFVAILKNNAEAKLFQTMAVRETEFYATIAALKRKQDQDLVPEPPDEPVTKPGDVWEIAGCRIMCGDATNPQDVATLMRGEKAAIVITDPPYGVDYVEQTKAREGRQKWRPIHGDDLKGKALESFCLKFLENIKAHTTPDSAYYIFFGMKTFHHLMAALDQTKIYYALPLIWCKGRPTISWAKYHPDYEVIAYAGSGAKGTRFRPESMQKQQGVRGVKGNAGNYTASYEPIAFAGNGSKPSQPRWYAKYDQTTTWFVRPDHNASYLHPTTKPVELAERALLNSSREGEICLDLFTGSGFAAIACHKLKRIFRGMEVEPEYVDVAVLRLEHYAQTPAVLIRNGKVLGTAYRSFINQKDKKPSGEKDGKRKV